MRSIKLIPIGDEVPPGWAAVRFSPRVTAAALALWLMGAGTVFGSLNGCGLLGAKAIEVATPVAISAAKKLVQSVADYVLSTGKEAKQVNCEEEWYPEDGELLILCTVKYEESTK